MTPGAIFGVSEGCISEFLVSKAFWEQMLKSYVPADATLQSQ